LKVVDPNSQVYLISGAQETKVQVTVEPPAPSSPNRSSTIQMSGAISEQLHYSAEATGVESDLTASLVSNGSGAPQEKYFVDNVSVSAEAYVNEREKFANSLMKLNFMEAP
jgi:hypothetical protein